MKYEIKKENIKVSVIVPTKNSEATLESCLISIKNQTYKNIEIIVVDNFSTDNTPEIAKKYADKFLQIGPERSAQVNFGVENSEGEFVYKVDSDFILNEKIIEECIQKCQEDFDAVVVHNTPDESIGWIAKIRKFEVDMYKYDLTHSSARFIKKEIYRKIGGFDSSVTAGEDYDFQNKLNRGGLKTGFVDAEALHLGEPKNIIPHLYKYYLYGKDFVNYVKVSTQDEKSEQLGFIRPVYIKNWKKFLAHPILGFSFIVYHFAKYGAGGLGFFVGKFINNKI